MQQRFEKFLVALVTNDVFCSKTFILYVSPVLSGAESEGSTVAHDKTSKTGMLLFQQFLQVATLFGQGSMQKCLIQAGNLCVFNFYSCPCPFRNGNFLENWDNIKKKKCVCSYNEKGLFSFLLFLLNHLLGERVHENS